MEQQNLFGVNGMMFYSPAPIKFDPLLIWFHQEFFIIIFLLLGFTASILFSLSKYRRVASLFLIVSILFIRFLNPYLYQVSWNYISWILWAHLIGFKDGRIPDHYYKYAWYLTGLALSLSGISKAVNTDYWLEGSAMRLFLQNPATMYSYSREFFVNLFDKYPAFSNVVSWGVLLMEVLSFPLILFYYGRKLFVILYLLMFTILMICTTLTFLEIGMIIWILFLLNCFDFKLSFRIKEAV